jgi:cytochrome c oxidase subunit IV
VSEHIVSPRIYLGIILTLMALTGLTIWVATVDLGPVNVVLALVIATLKAALVVLYFMHARYSPGRTKLVIVAGLFWLAILLVMTLADYLTRSWQHI